MGVAGLCTKEFERKGIENMGANYIKEIEERYENLLLLIDHVGGDIKIVPVLQDIQNLLALVKAYEKHLGKMNPIFITEIKKQIFEKQPLIGEE